MLKNINHPRAESAEHQPKKQFNNFHRKHMALLYKRSSNKNYIKKHIPTIQKLNFFPGLEISNITLAKPLVKRRRKTLANKEMFKSNEDSYYEPLEFQDYLQNNLKNIIFDESYRQISNSPAIFKAGKVHMGPNYKNTGKSLENMLFDRTKHKIRKTLNLRVFNNKAYGGKARSGRSDDGLLSGLRTLSILNTKL